MTSTQSEAPPLLLDVIDGGIAVVSYNRPEKLNAIPAGFGEHIRGAIERIQQDDDIHAVVLTGEGRAFCAGADMTKLSGSGYGEHQPDSFPIDPVGHWPIMWFGMIIHKPVICAVNGAAIGYGAEVAATCDIRIASESARFGWVFSKLGIVCDMGVGPIMLPKLVGIAEAARLLYTSEIIDAREALRIGLVSEVVPNDQLRARAIEIARKCASGAPLSNQFHKRQMMDALYRNPHEVYFENLHDWEKVTKSDDFKEGAKAFFEKRVPTWVGR